MISARLYYSHREVFKSAWSASRRQEMARAISRFRKRVHELRGVVTIPHEVP
jgi:hypothetical protein